MNKLITSESVTEGHPDKMCDQISDAILDVILEKDPYGRVACETMVTNGIVFVTGEITTDCYVDIPMIVRDTIRQIGYNKAEYGFDYRTCGVMVAINQQSPDISMGVYKSSEYKYGSRNKYDIIGAGDQGMVVGYATNETDCLMPLSIKLAHELSYKLAEVRKTQLLPKLRPDGKTQVTVAYENNKPVGIDNIVIACQHDEDYDAITLEKNIWDRVILPTINKYNFKCNNIFINNTGKFVTGGPVGDTGCTGRKIIVDTYGGVALHGGGAFSGKDPTKVDRSGAYFARYIAKNVVAAGLADRFEIQLSYVIGKASPTAMYFNTFGTNKVSEPAINTMITELFDPRPAAIIDLFQLRNPIYRQTACYGHFGNPNYPWEKIDRVYEIRNALADLI